MRPVASLCSTFILVLISSFGVAPGASADDQASAERKVKGDQLKMTTPAEAASNRPARGMSMDKVQSAYGAPTRKVAAVGAPPIERWEYPNFTVYFEYQKVIHAVANP